MVDCEPYDLSKLPSLEMPAEEKEKQWRIWASREIQQRALLAHYALDGLISQMTGEPTSTRHATNKLVIPSCECAFEAATADCWIKHMQPQSFPKPSFQRLLHQLFRPSTDSIYTGHAFTAFSFRMMLEGLQSLSTDCEGDVSAVGIPSRTEIQGALCQLYQHVTKNPHLLNPDRLETLLRLHTICLDMNINSTLLCRHLCHRMDVEQHLWKKKKEELSDLDICRWVVTSKARKALLHAIAIQEIVEELPRGRAHAIHMPSSLFSAATIYATFSLAGVNIVKVPSTIVWTEVLLDLNEYSFNPPQLLNTASASDTIRFIRQEPLFGAASNRNLLYQLNSVDKLFHCLSSQWGIAIDKEKVIEQWITFCR
jgi:hypothetical protein